MDVPEKLTPIPGFTLNYLPAWIADFGTMDWDEYPDGIVVMTAKGPNGEFFHIDAWPKGAAFDDSFWERYVYPMVGTMGQQLFMAEYGDILTETLRWQWAEAAGERELTQKERDIITRREQLTTWTPPIQASVD